MTTLPKSEKGDREPVREFFAAASRELGGRTLEQKLSALLDYLQPGDRVLDVGCGPGSITLDVARSARAPGLVVGVDHSAKLLAEARRRANAARAQNLAFKRGDAYHLGLGTGVFDLTYSHALLDWLREPVGALVEQRRVTRRGGVIFIRVSDLGTQSFYPPCPDLETVIRGLRHLATQGAAQSHWNPFLGSAVEELFQNAGLETIDVRGWADCYRSPSPDQNGNLVKGILLSCTRKPYSGPVRQLLAEGRVDDFLLARAHEQVRALADHPAGMSIRAGVYAAARVP